MSQATETTLRAALIEAEAGLEFAAAQLPQTTGFVPAHVAALQIVRAALSTAAAQPPALPPGWVAVPLTTEQIEAIAHRTAWRYKKSSDPHHSDTYTFNRHTLIDFVRAITNAQGAPDA